MPISRKHVVAEACEHDAIGIAVLVHKRQHFAHGDRNCILQWIAVYAAADGGERNRFQMMFARERASSSAAARATSPSATINFKMSSRRRRRSTTAGRGDPVDAMDGGTAPVTGLAIGLLYTA